MEKIMTIRNAKQINAAIQSTAKRGTKWADEVQTLLVEIAGHMVCHNEPSLGKKMLAAYANTKHAETLASWFAAHTVYVERKGEAAINLTRFTNLTEGFVTSKDGQHVEAAEHHMAELAKLPRWDYVAPDESDDAKERIFDALATVEELIASLSKKAVEQGKAADRASKGQTASKKAMSYEHLDLERYLRNAVEQYKADRAVFESMKGE